MLKLLIVEDEMEIRQGIINIFDWTEYGIDICGEAENGREALEKIEALKPDLLLLDIRMPIMDGITVLKALSKQHRNIYSVILSGYDEFSYVKQALKYGASDYLLKPCDPAELLEAILRLKKQLINERQYKETINRYNKEIKENLPVLKEKHLYRLLNGDVEVNQFESMQSFYHFNIINTISLAVCITIDEYEDVKANSPFRNIELLYFAIKNIALEVLAHANYDAEVVEYDESIVLVINVPDLTNKDNLYDCIRTLKSQINTYLQITVSIGIGQEYLLKDITVSYKEAKDAIHSKFWSGPDGIHLFVQGDENEDTIPTYPINEEKAIVKLLRKEEYSMNELKKRLDNFFNVYTLQSISKDIVQQTGIILALSIYRKLLEIHPFTSRQNSLKMPAIIDQMFYCDTFEQIKGTILELIEATRKLASIRPVPTNKTVAYAMTYIEQHFAEDLSLQEVADAVHISTAYLSSLFKKNCGMSFIEYLHNIRIKKACKLLQDNIFIKTNVVAKRVGYNDERYFYRIFKKITGLTPTEYKDKL